MLKYIVPITLIFISLFAILPQYVGGPITWDELLYMDLSLNPKGTSLLPAYPISHVMNRYFHIYFQKLFFWLSKDALLGSKVLWAFLISLTSCLVFFNASILTKASNYLNGMIALIFFASQPLIFREYVGVTYADYTVMMLITVGVSIFLLYQRVSRYRRLLLFALGLTFFFAIRSKETGVCLGVLFLGVTFGEESNFHWKSFIWNIAMIMIGILSGIFVFIILNQLFLSDAFFGFRLSDIRELLRFNFGEYPRREYNYYSNGIFTRNTFLLVPFLLYLFNTAKYHMKFSKAHTIAWSLPLAIIVFLTFCMISSIFGVIDRYLIPAVPIICIYASQFIFIKHWSFQKQIITLSSIVIGCLIAVIFHYFISEYSYGFGWSITRLYLAIIYPFGLSLLLILIMMTQNRRFLTLTLVFFCLFLVSYLPLYRNITLLRSKGVAYMSEKKFYPLSAFAKQIRYSDRMKFFISGNIRKEHKMFSRNRMSSNWMFNVFFNQHAEISQFEYSENPEDITKENYTYALLTKNDWDNIISSRDAKFIRADYEMFTDEKSKIVFLTLSKQEINK